MLSTGNPTWRLARPYAKKGKSKGKETDLGCQNWRT